MLMAPLEHIELSDRVYAQIRDMILAGELMPGEKIYQEKLADQLGVSRTPLLKALQRLEHEFLVTSVPRRGVYVKKISLDEVIDVFYSREVLEGLAAKLAARRRTDTELERLKALFYPFRDQTAIDVKQYESADRAFHPLMFQMSHSPTLARMENIGNVLIMAYQAQLVRPPEETLEEHLTIIRAIETGNSDLAEEMARTHVRKSRESLENRVHK
jgi:DNA-binding GntR family transcriptional regulator